MDAAWGEERLGIACVSKHHDSEDESVGVGMGWDGWTQPFIGNEAMHRNQETGSLHLHRETENCKAGH